MSGPIEVTCSHCEGAGEITWYTSCIAGGLDYQVRCLACHGTGWVPVTSMPGWAQAQADLVRADQLRRHQAALDAELAYQTGVAAELVDVQRMLDDQADDYAHLPEVGETRP